MSFSAFEQPQSMRGGQVAHKDRQARYLIIGISLTAVLIILWDSRTVKKIVIRSSLRITIWALF